MAQQTGPEGLVIAAHRGSSSIHPDNSSAAIEAALEVARNYPEFSFFIELDIRRSKDGTFVCSHDPRIKNGAGKVLKIGQATWPEIKIHGGGGIAALDEAMELVSSFNVRHQGRFPVGLALDIKPSWTDGFWRHAVFASGRAFVEVILGRLSINLRKSGEARSGKLTGVLADVFNACADDARGKIPALVFSSSGIVGKKYLESFWAALSPKTKMKFHRQPSLGNAAPVIAPGLLFESRKGRPFAALYFRVCKRIKSFWCIEPEGIHDVKPSFAVLDKKEDMLGIVRIGGNWITTNQPELAARVLRDYFHARSQNGNNAGKQAVKKTPGRAVPGSPSGKRDLS